MFTSMDGARRWDVVFCSLLLCSSAYGFNTGNLGRGINGGLTCSVCTVAVSMVEQLALIHNQTITEAVEHVCNFLPESFKLPCTTIVDVFGKDVIEMLTEKETPDVVCYNIHLCHVDKGQQYCHLYPQPKEGLARRVEKTKPYIQARLQKRVPGFMPHFSDPCSLPGVKWVCAILSKIFSNHEPGLDVDNDGFSTIQAFRGSSWRGMDCEDLKKNFHPGARPISSDMELDSNCNGILGHDKQGRAYEDLLCKGSGQRGVAILGDSVGAHFHIPPQWFTPAKFSKEIFEHFAFVIENEGDWPMMSGATGYMNSTWGIISGPVDSLYLRMRQRNRCNHRDYQNLAVNGADTFDTQNYQLNLARNQTTDLPLILVYSLVGNDVCNHFPDTVAHMTTPEEMRENVLKTLKYLDTRLPSDSHVLLIGMADGRVLWETLHNRIHPLGELRKDLTYAQVYGWFNCMQTTPCYGYMSSDEAIRNATSKRAAQLSMVLKEVAQQYQTTFKHFDVHYLDNPLAPVVEEWKKSHGLDSVWQLLEPVDGFHPNQIAQALTADYVWKQLEATLPHYIGKINPNNDKIAQIFKDQGGYK